MLLSCNILFIDESGEGSPVATGKDRFWVTTGVCSNLDEHEAISKRLDEIKELCLRNPKNELKGSEIKHRLKPDVTLDRFVELMGALIEDYRLKIWIIGTGNEVHDDGKFVSSNPNKGVLPKDVTRELLLHKLSSYAKRHSKDEDIYEIIWDLSDVHELTDYSRIVDSYVDPHDNRKLDRHIITKLLGGLSHDWAELQIADIISNFALNYIAAGSSQDGDLNKALTFKKHIYPKLYKTSSGINGAGWKMHDMDWKDKSVKYIEKKLSDFKSIP